MGKLLRITILALLLIPVTFSGCSINKQTITVPTVPAITRSQCPELFTAIEYNNKRICVMKDYYTVNGVRQPLDYNQAMTIATKNGWSLPTPDLVDVVWRQADCKLDPIPMQPGPAMTGAAYTQRHNRLINQQLANSNYTECNLIAGHKKDVVVQQARGRVTIYGWHRRNGIPIQPVSSVHGAGYADYSHGVRFIVNGN